MIYGHSNRRRQRRQGAAAQKRTRVLYRANGTNATHPNRTKARKGARKSARRAANCHSKGQLTAHTAQHYFYFFGTGPHRAQDASQGAAIADRGANKSEGQT